MRALRVGLTRIKRRIPGADESAKAVGSGTLEVWSTPSMIATMEMTAMELAEEHLGPGETTVGTMVSVEHVAASLTGREITCTAILVEIDSRRLTFSVKVEEGSRLLGSGTHSRFIIDETKFIDKLSKV